MAAKILEWLLRFARKDGGSESLVWAWGFESKAWGSIQLLLFKEGSRDAFHSHAFNSFSFLLWGALVEEFLPDRASFWEPVVVRSRAHISPAAIFTMRTDFHKVTCLTPTAWVLTVRGPWAAMWREQLPGGGRKLSAGRKIIPPEDTQ